MKSIDVLTVQTGSLNLGNKQYAIRQALFVDSKAEKIEGQSSVTIQTAQTSMIIRHIRSGKEVEEFGKLPSVIETELGNLLTTTIFVKYNYKTEIEENLLQDIFISALPNGFLQNRYNPTPKDTFWRAGRNAPTLEEAFRVRIAYNLLKRKANWRVQKIPMSPIDFIWDE
ncbi:MAG: hypothetical protein FJ126_07100 [Deltaproteobacteria bacterium]|nr:hypothetical protein [Deltaproteobacteria bacterium]